MACALNYLIKLLQNVVCAIFKKISHYMQFLLWMARPDKNTLETYVNLAAMQDGDMGQYG